MGRQTIEHTTGTGAAPATPRAGEVGPRSGALSGTGRVVRLLSRTWLSLPGDAQDGALSRMAGVLSSPDARLDGIQVETVEFTGLAGTGIHRGHNVNTHPGGEKTYIAYRGSMGAVPQNGSVVMVFQGVWWCIGGTGQYRNLTAHGTYRGQLTPIGPQYTFQGQWSIERAAFEPAPAADRFFYGAEVPR